MNYNQLIKNWHTKASDEDYFSKFVFEYLAFIAFLKKRKFIDATNDRNAIQRLKQDESTKSIYLQKITSDEVIKKSLEKIKEELDRAPLGNVSGNGSEVEEIKWWNCSSIQLTTQTDQLSSGRIRDLNDWGNMVEFWYSIRNNLFHGSKNPEEGRDKLVVEHGYKTLSPLVEIFLAENN